MVLVRWDGHISIAWQTLAGPVPRGTHTRASHASLPYLGGSYLSAGHLFSSESLVVVAVGDEDSSIDGRTQRGFPCVPASLC